MSKQRINNDAPAHKYFTTMLNMADDDLDPFQYRLLAHYVRVCGQDGKDVIDESVRETAKATQMSAVKVQKARDQLEAMGYLRVSKPTKAEARKGETVHIGIIDRWAENISRYAKAVSKITQPADEAVSDLTQQPVSEITHDVSEAVLNLTRSLNNNKEQDSISPVGDDAPKSNRKPDALFDYVALQSFGIAHVNGDKELGARVAKISTWLKKRSATLEQLERFYPWYDKSTERSARPRDVGKFAEWFAKFEAVPPPTKIIPLDIDPADYPRTDDYIDLAGGAS